MPSSYVTHSLHDPKQRGSPNFVLGLFPTTLLHVTGGRNYNVESYRPPQWVGPGGRDPLGLNLKGRLRHTLRPLPRRHSPPGLLCLPWGRDRGQVDALRVSAVEPTTPTSLFRPGGVGYLVSLGNRVHLGRPNPKSSSVERGGVQP